MFFIDFDPFLFFLMVLIVLNMTEVGVAGTECGGR